MQRRSRPSPETVPAGLALCARYPQPRWASKTSSTLLPSFRCRRLSDDTDVQVEVLEDPDPPARGGRGQFFKGALSGSPSPPCSSSAASCSAHIAAMATARPTAAAAGPAWSSWKPSTSGDAAATEIAVHVGRTYREPNGGQLVRVDGGPLQVAGVPLTVAQRDSVDAGGSVRLFEGKTLLYRLCGQGKSCAISDGKPSLERHMLLRREALELALYSLRYMKGIGPGRRVPPAAARRRAQPGAVLPQGPGRRRAREAARSDAGRPRADHRAGQEVAGRRARAAADDSRCCTSSRSRKPVRTTMHFCCSTRSTRRRLRCSPRRPHRQVCRCREPFVHVAGEGGGSLTRGVNPGQAPTGARGYFG